MPNKNSSYKSIQKDTVRLKGQLIFASIFIAITKFIFYLGPIALLLIILNKLFNLENLLTK